MVKNWKEFILENKNLSEIGNLELKEFNSKDYSLLGLTTTEITDWSYILNKNKFYLSDVEIQFIDKDGWIRKDIKIGEKLRPCIYISISTQSTSKENQETIKQIKGILKKIKAISKFKSKTELNNMVVFDPNTKSKSDLNIIGEIIKLEDPFSIISSKGSKIKYDYNNEEILSTNLDVCLYSDEEIEVTDKDFFNFYKLNTTETEYLDKDGKFWVEFDFKEVASAIFKDDDLVETYFNPEDWDFDAFDVDKKSIIDEIVSCISNENKEKLLRRIGDFNEMNNVTGEEYEDLEHLITNVTNNDLEIIFNDLDDFNFDILSDIVWQYKDELNVKYQQKAESYIREETIKYIEEYIKFDYHIHKDNEDQKELIFIKYNPSIFEYEYDDSEDPDDWSDWADRLHSTNLDGSISETLDEHSDQIRWDDYLGDNIYMSSDDINNYLNDIL